MIQTITLALAFTSMQMPCKNAKAAYKASQCCVNPSGTTKFDDLVLPREYRHFNYDEYDGSPRTPYNVEIITDPEGRQLRKDKLMMFTMMRTNEGSFFDAGGEFRLNHWHGHSFRIGGRVDRVAGSSDVAS